MRRKLPLLLLSLTAAAACSDDPSNPPSVATYSIESAEPALTLAQDASMQLQLTVKRGDELVKYPKTGSITISAAGFSPETLHVDAGAVVTWSNPTGVNHQVIFARSGAINSVPTSVVNIPNPTPPGGTFTSGDSVRTLPNSSRDTTYNYRDNLPGHNYLGSIRVHASPALTYRSDDYTIANVSSVGLVTGIRAGSTTIRVTGSGASLDIPVTVVGRPADDIELTFLDPLRLGDRLTEDTIYAYPADAASTQLRAVVMAGTDTVFCNRCSTFNVRPQRYVTFTSRDTTKVLVRNTANPILRADTTGRLFARDTTRGDNGVWVVLETADEVKDSVLVHIKLRPIDSLDIRLDSFPDPNDPEDKDPYLSTAIRVDSTVALGVNFWARVQDPPIPNPLTPAADTLPTARYIPVRETGTGRRTALPIVTWETAHSTYAEITSTGVVTGRRWFTDQQARVLRCDSQVNATSGGLIPSTLFSGPVQDTLAAVAPVKAGVPRLPLNPEANYTIPGCVAAPTVPAGGTEPARVLRKMPGLLCTGFQTSSIVADPTSICQIQIRAQATDPVTGRVLRDFIAILVRRP